MESAQNNTVSDWVKKCHDELESQDRFMLDKLV